MAKNSAEHEIKRFQSEVDEIREAPEPLGLRVTTWVTAGVMISCIAFAAVARVDRVVTSDRGNIVPAQGTVIFQA